MTRTFSADGTPIGNPVDIVTIPSSTFASGVACTGLLNGQAGLSWGKGTPNQLSAQGMYPNGHVLDSINASISFNCYFSLNKSPS